MKSTIALFAAALLALLAPFSHAQNRPAADGTLTDSIGIKLVPIPAGQFMMGSGGNEPHRMGDETQHKVMISKDFYIGATLVTQAQWKALMGDNPSQFKGPDDLPVEQVNWDRATEFCDKLSAKEHKKYHLPTEAQWEYAARAGTQTTYFWGNDESKLGDYAWYSANSGGRTHPVATKLPNPWGLYDITGNLGECIFDWYGGFPRSGVTVDPQGPPQGSLKVIKGGGWDGDANACRMACRMARHDEHHWSHDLGFRVVMESE
jgi:formylglycine-generating enzyme required for sulfatase activity